MNKRRGSHPLLVFIWLLAALFIQTGISSMGADKGVALVFFPALFFLAVIPMPLSAALGFSFLFGLFLDVLSSMPLGIYIAAFLSGTLIQYGFLKNLNEERASSRFLAVLTGLGSHYAALGLLVYAASRALSVYPHLVTEFLFNILVFSMIMCVGHFVGIKRSYRFHV